MIEYNNYTLEHFMTILFQEITYMLNDSIDIIISLYEFCWDPFLYSEMSIFTFIEKVKYWRLGFQAQIFPSK